MDERIATMHLPAAVVARILKDENIAATKDSRDTMSRATAVFMLNLSSLACQNAADKNHKTVTAEDVLRALKALDNDIIYSQSKQAVEEWKVVKAQKALKKKSAATAASASAESSPTKVRTLQGSQESPSTPQL